jgi:hypothetical protein
MLFVPERRRSRRPRAIRAERAQRAEQSKSRRVDDRARCYQRTRTRLRHCSITSWRPSDASSSVRFHNPR